jgi:lysophospholipid acyltransferase (LPLAT)-like uncharacterized protein
MKRLSRHPAVQAAAAWLLGAYLALVYRTTRWTLENERFAVAAATEGRPVILAFWHERLPLMGAAQWLARRRFPGVRPVGAHVLVSRHRDGRLVGRVVERFGFRMIYASSSKGGAAGLLALVRLLRAGQAVGITPDGPRGPRRRAAPGVAQLAALSGAPVVAAAVSASRHRRLRSWDRMMIPLPFGRGAIVFTDPVMVARDAAEASLPAIAAALTAACDRADALAGVAPAPAGRG